MQRSPVISKLLILSMHSIATDKTNSLDGDKDERRKGGIFAAHLKGTIKILKFIWKNSTELLL